MLSKVETESLEALWDVLCVTSSKLCFFFFKEKGVFNPFEDLILSRNPDFFFNDSEEFYKF